MIAYAAGGTLLALLFAAQNYAVGRGGGADVWLALVHRELARWHAWTVLAPLVVLLVRRFGVGPARPPWHALVLLASAVPFAGLRTLLAVSYAVLFLGMPIRGSFPASVREAMTGRFAFDVLVYLLLLVLVHAMLFAREAQRRALATARLEAQLSAARLSALEAQLHPHFLFNTLHTTNALLDRDVTAARRVLTRFGELLRMVLDTRVDANVPLSWEMRFLDSYAEIQRARFGERLTLRFDVEADTAAARVPRLLLQPLVENAVRHGVERAERAVAVDVRARRRGEELVLEIADTGPGLHADAQERVGLGTTRARLQEAYGSRASLVLLTNEPSGTLVRLVLPFETAP